MHDYDSIIRSIRARQNPNGLTLDDQEIVTLENFSYKEASNKVYTMVADAMKPMSKKYTDAIIKAGDNVKCQLQERLRSVTYRYQGSVVSNTHIRAKSDIDLVVIDCKSFQWESDWINKYASNENASKNLVESVRKLQYVESLGKYEGSNLVDLRNNRISSEQRLSYYPPKCKPKSLKVNEGGFDVDVVIAGEYRDIDRIVAESVKDQEIYQGFQIYCYLGKDNAGYKDAPDFPFRRIHFLNQKDALYKGNLKKSIRLLKTLKAESLIDKTDKLNGFIFNSIVYAIDNWIGNDPASILSILYDQLKRIARDENYRNSLRSIDGKEAVFQDKPEESIAIVQVVEEIKSIVFQATGRYL